MLWDTIHPGLKLWTSLKQLRFSLANLGFRFPFSCVFCPLAKTKAKQGLSSSAFPGSPMAIIPGSPISFSFLIKFHKDSTQTFLYYFSQIHTIYFTLPSFTSEHLQQIPVAATRSLCNTCPSCSSHWAFSWIMTVFVFTSFPKALRFRVTYSPWSYLHIFCT